MAHTAGQNTRENPRRNKRTKAEDNLTPSKHKKNTEEGRNKEEDPPNLNGLVSPHFSDLCLGFKKKGVWGNAPPNWPEEAT